MTVYLVARPTCPLDSFMQDTLWYNAAWTVHASPGRVRMPGK